ncbi:Trafficking protein particle complex subunit 8 [Nymphon striatum]|nr:Trafficking protein particle complex subunit 8 [Nymphon striatum]
MRNPLTFTEVWKTIYLRTDHVIQQTQNVARQLVDSSVNWMKIVAEMQTAQEFIQDCFSPMIAVLCSTDADLLCMKNNLSFVELVQPFSRLTIDDLCVSSFSIHPGSTPWFEAYRTSFLQVSYPSDHEFTKTYLACIFVVASNHSDPIEQINKLSQQQQQQQHQSPSKLPKWFTPNIFKYYVLLHDFSVGDISSRTETIYQTMVSQFGSHACHLLQINSNASGQGYSDSPVKTDIWCQYLTKKVVKSDTFESNPRTPQDASDQIFPGHVTEGAVLSESVASPEEGVEITEQIDSPENVDHPLATYNNNSQKNNIKPSRIECVEEKDSPLGPNFTDANGIVGKFPINQDDLISQVSTQNDQHGRLLSVSDIDRISIFINEFCLRGFLPYIEKLMRNLNEQVSNRKGLHKSLFSATKKWFGGNKTGLQSLAVPSNSVIYSQEALELQVRRLGDVAFMFQNYELAYQAYHSAKRDFENDHAWLYNAGAMEMAGLSIFMQGGSSQRPYPKRYFENAIGTYQSCKSAEFATRAAILSTECLKSLNQFSDSAMQYIRMTSEDSDLRSALLLEQAAYCFIASKSSSKARKYAFHMILAGHRFSKAGQRKHSLRCYKQAYQIYKNKGWSLAEDHINFTIGRQSVNLKELKKACLAFKNVLIEDGKQSAAQQAAMFKEFLFVYKELSEQKAPEQIPELESLPIPKVMSQSVKVMVANFQPEESIEYSNESNTSFCYPEKDNNAWSKLEELALKNHSNFPSIYNPSLPCYTVKTNNSVLPQVVVNEAVTLEIELANFLKVPLLLSNIFLIWKFHEVNADGVKSEEAIMNSYQSVKMSVADEIVETQHISELNLEGLQSKKIYLNIKPRVIGELQILGISYGLGTSVSNENENNHFTQSSVNNIKVIGQQYFNIQGPRLNNTKKERFDCIYGKDCRFNLKVVDALPLLQVKFHNSPSSLLSGEVKQMLVEFTNIGQKTLQGLYVASDNPNMITFGQANVHMQMDFGVYKASPVASPRKNSNKTQKPSSVLPVYINKDYSINRVCQIPLGSDCDTLESNQSIRVPLWIWAPEKSGEYELKMLFYYHLENNKNRFRILRHQFKFYVHNSIEVQALASKAGSTCLPNPSERDQSKVTNSLHVGLEVSNANEVSDSNIAEINLVQISSVSSKWSLLSLRNDNKEGLCINPGEKAHMSFKTLPFAVNDIDDSNKNVLIFSNIPFTDSEIDSTSCPCSDFYHRSRFKLGDLMAPDPPPAAMIPEVAPPSQKELDVEAIKSAIIVDLTIIVLWKAFIVDEIGLNHVVMGQHHIYIDQINTPTCSRAIKMVEEEKQVLKIILSEEEESLLEEAPLITETLLSQLVKFTLNYPHEVFHDFLKSRSCIVPITVILINCSEVSLAVKVLIDYKTVMLPSDTLSPQFTWIGCHNTSLELTAGERKEIKIMACFISSGTFNLSNFRVKVRPIKLRSDILIPADDDGYVSQKNMQSSVIVISQS